MPTKKYVYKFAEGNKDMREILGGKGANLAEMARLGFPVPNGFTVSTEACTQYYEDGREINAEIQAQINEHIAWLEKENGKKTREEIRGMSDYLGDFVPEFVENEEAFVSDVRFYATALSAEDIQKLYTFIICRQYC